MPLLARRDARPRPGLDRPAGRPDRVAPPRAHPAADGAAAARGRRLGARDLAGRRARRRGPVPLRDGARIRSATRSCVERAPRRRRGGPHDRRAGDRADDRCRRRRAARPRVRSGYALKRLEAAEGDAALGAQATSAAGSSCGSPTRTPQLFGLLDGDALAHRARWARPRSRSAPTGPARLAPLLAELGDARAAAGVARARPRRGEPPDPRWLRPRETRAAARGDAVRARCTGGRLACCSRAGADGVGDPRGGGARASSRPRRRALRDAVRRRDKVGFGGVVFLLGRFAVVALHETAHGLAMASSGGRRARPA